MSSRVARAFGGHGNRQNKYQDRNQVSMPKTVSATERSLALDDAANSKVLEHFCIEDVIRLDAPLLEETPVTLGPGHPRPMLPSRVAIIGNYLPRQCGIATFTADLCD